MSACVRSCSVMSDSLRPYGLQPARLLCQGDSPGRNAGVGWHALLQGICLTQVSYVSCIDRQALYHQHHLGSPALVLGYVTAHVLTFTEIFISSHGFELLQMSFHFSLQDSLQHFLQGMSKGNKHPQFLSGNILIFLSFFFFFFASYGLWELSSPTGD